MSKWSFGSKRAPRGNIFLLREKKVWGLKQCFSFSFLLPKQEGESPILKTVITQQQKRTFTTAEPVTDSGVLRKTWNSQAASFRSHRKALGILHLSASLQFPAHKAKFFGEYTVKALDNISIYSVWDVQIILGSFFSMEAVSKTDVSLSNMPTQGLW